MFLLAIIIIALISILWSLWSLRKLYHRPEINHAKKELTRERVVFHGGDTR